MKLSTLRSFLCLAAIAVGLLGAAPGAAPAAPPPPAKASPLHTNLTSAASVASPVISSGEDIRDIRQPRHLPTPWRWAVSAAVLPSWRRRARTISGAPWLAKALIP